MRGLTRRGPRRNVTRVVPVDRPSAGGQLVALALEARLLGRLRLLTVDAVVDIADLPSRSPLVVDGRRREAPPSMRSRRAEAEALLQDARRVLAAAPRTDRPGAAQTVGRP